MATTRPCFLVKTQLRNKKRDCVLFANYAEDAKAIAELESGLKVLLVKPLSKTESALRWKLSSRFREENVAVLFESVARLLAVKVSISEALRMQIPSVRSPKTKFLLWNICESLEKGFSVSEAFAETQLFSAKFIAMLRGGEKSNDLIQIFREMAQSFKEAKELKSKLRSQMIYPAIVLSVGICMFLGFSFFVIPKVQEIYESSGYALPTITQFFLSISLFLRTPLAGILFVLFCGLFGIKSLRLAVFRFGKKMFLKLPRLGEFFRLKDVSEVLEHWVLLIKSGVGASSAVGFSKNVVLDGNFAKTLGDIEKDLLKGKNLSESVRENNEPFGKFRYELMSALDAGERSGNVVEPLQNLAHSYRNDLKIQTENFKQILTPVVSILLAVFGFFLVLSVLYPFINLIKLIMEETSGKF